MSPALCDQIKDLLARCLNEVEESSPHLSVDRSEDEAAQLARVRLYNLVSFALGACREGRRLAEAAAAKEEKPCPS